MSGIYIHIPFCRTKCHYCNFVSIASMKFRDEYVKALHKEINQQRDFYLPETPVETIYLGGGTPSLLDSWQIDSILQCLHKEFSIQKNAEITLEINPDDVSTIYLKQLGSIGINRLSIGVQSFHDEELKYLGRRHDAAKSIESVILARDIGFDNISIDFIYGLPAKFSCDPAYNIEQAIKLKVEHISAYSLTMEKNTILAHQVKKEKKLPPDEELSAEHFVLYMNLLKEVGYDHYEISNFAKSGYRSVHNSNYWQNKPYLGIGAGAHSYDLNTRFWNTSFLADYISGIENKNPVREKEILSTEQKYNEYILLSLRTSQGVSLSIIQSRFGQKYTKYFLSEIAKHINNEHIVSHNSIYCLTDAGKLWADMITEKLMI